MPSPFRLPSSLDFGPVHDVQLSTSTYQLRGTVGSDQYVRIISVNTMFRRTDAFYSVTFGGITLQSSALQQTKGKYIWVTVFNKNTAQRLEEYQKCRGFHRACRTLAERRTLTDTNLPPAVHVQDTFVAQDRTYVQWQCTRVSHYA